ncbi:MAG: MBG domain-containing protein, partial [Oscillospiraceae bacterium]
GNTNHPVGTANAGTAITTAKKVFAETVFHIVGGSETVTGAQLLVPRSFSITNGTVTISSLAPSEVFGPFVPGGAAFTSVTGPDIPQVMASVAILDGKLDFISELKPTGFVATDVYTITVSSNDYQDFVFTIGFSACEKMSAVITAAIDVKVYDGNQVGEPTPSAKVGNDPLVLQYTYQWKQGDAVLNTAPRNGGDYTLVINGSNDNFVGSLTLPFTIGKKPLTVTAVDKFVVSGDAPAFAFTSDGLVLGETLTDVAYNCSYDKDNLVPGMARTAIIPHGGTVSSGNDNYAISYVPGTLTISPDKDALNAAIAEAEALKVGIKVSDKTPGEVESGKRFVSSAVMTALENAITVAKQVVEAALNSQNIADAMTALAQTSATFRASIQTGTYNPGGGGGGGGGSTPK